MLFACWSVAITPLQAWERELPFPAVRIQTHLGMLFRGTIGSLYQKPFLVAERHPKEMMGPEGGEYTQLHGQV